MAKVISSTNKLATEYEKHLNSAKKFFVISGVSFLLFLPTFIIFGPTFGSTGVPLIVCFILGSMNYNKAIIYKSGLVGEKVSERVLADLPEGYYVFPSIDVEFEGKKSQIDHLVVGPNGVFIVEAKNIKGHVVGSDEDRDITVHKVGEEGGQYLKKIYNPTKQVSTHVYRTSNFLKNTNISAWVQGIVYFTNMATTVNLQSEKIPVFAESEDGKKDLYNYIVEYVARKDLNDREVKRIVDLFTDEIKGKSTYNFEEGSPINDYDMLQNDVLNQQMHQQLQHQHNQWAMDETRKVVTPVDHGGYMQGPGFNPSDTMAQNDMMNSNMDNGIF